MQAMREHATARGNKEGRGGKGRVSARSIQWIM